MTCDCPTINAEVSYYSAAVSADNAEITHWQNQKMTDQTYLSYWQAQALMCGCSMMAAPGQATPTIADLEQMEKDISRMEEITQQSLVDLQVANLAKRRAKTHLDAELCLKSRSQQISPVGTPSF